MTWPALACVTSTGSEERALEPCSTSSWTGGASTPPSVTGYSREEFTHLAVAAAVAAGRADAGLGIRAAAQAFGLNFVPVAWEPYDLVLRARVLESALLAPLWELLAMPSFQEKVEQLGGYSCREMGRRIR